MAPRQKRKQPDADEGEEIIISGLAARASRLVVDTCKKKADRTVGTAKVDVDKITARGRQLTEKTHRDQLNKLHSDLVRALAVQDAKLAEIWAELVKMDQQSGETLQGCLDHFDLAFAGMDRARTGCRGGIDEHLQNEGAAALDAFQRNVSGEYQPVKKCTEKSKRRDTDATLVNSDA